MANLFPWKKTESQQREKAIKWTVTNAKYEIYVCELDEIELSALVAHCMDFRNKVLSVVSVDAHKTKSMMRISPLPFRLFCPPFGITSLLNLQTTLTKQILMSLPSTSLQPIAPLMIVMISSRNFAQAQRLATLEYNSFTTASLSSTATSIGSPDSRRSYKITKSKLLSMDPCPLHGVNVSPAPESWSMQSQLPKKFGTFDLKQPSGPFENKLRTKPVMNRNWPVSQTTKPKAMEKGTSNLHIPMAATKSHHPNDESMPTLIALSILDPINGRNVMKTFVTRFTVERQGECEAKLQQQPKGHSIHY